MKLDLNVYKNVYMLARICKSIFLCDFYYAPSAGFRCPTSRLTGCVNLRPSDTLISVCVCYLVFQVVQSQFMFLLFALQLLSHLSRELKHNQSHRFEVLVLN